MTLSVDGVRLKVRKRNWLFSAGIIAAEIVLSFFLYVSFAAHILWPESTHAAVGVSTLLSYEGRLMDSSGNPLGGTGQPYCYRFSIYDSSTSGSKLWPAGTPNVTVSTTTDGVFNALVGQADALTYNFYDSDTVYLNVDVNTSTSTDGSTCSGSWETLSPRQQIAATGYSEAAKNLYGTMLKTNITSNRVDVGAGTGSSNPVLLALDVNSSNQYVGQSCGTNGTIWYNSAQSNSLICNGGFIENVGTTGTTTVAGVQIDNNSPLSAGTVFFSNGNGVSWGLNGQTITASVNGGGAGYTLSYYENMPAFAASQTLSLAQSTSIVEPFMLNGPISASYIRIPVQMSTASVTLATTANTTFSAGQSSTWNAVIYSRGTGASSLSLQSVVSGSAGATLQVSLQANGNGSQYTQTYNYSYPVTGVQTNFTTQTSVSQTNFSLATASLTAFTGTRFIDIPLATSLSAGNYWIAVGVSTNSGGNVAAATGLRIFYSNLWVVSQPNWVINPMGVAANASNQLQLGIGSFSTNGGAGTTASMGFSNISSSGSNNRLYFQFIRIT